MRRDELTPKSSNCNDQFCSMKTTLLMFAFGLLAWPVASQTFSIDWFKISGGGGTSAGGQYSLSGAVGQHDAGRPLTNGQYSLTGGFWVLPQAIQVIEAPVLTITNAAPGSSTISWTPAGAGFILQEYVTLSAS